MYSYVNERATQELKYIMADDRGELRNHYKEIVAGYKKQGIDYDDAYNSLVNQIDEDVSDTIDKGIDDAERYDNWILSALLYTVSRAVSADYEDIAENIIGDEEDYNRIDSKNRLPVRRKTVKKSAAKKKTAGRR